MEMSISVLDYVIIGHNVEKSESWQKSESNRNPFPKLIGAGLIGRFLVRAIHLQVRVFPDCVFELSAFSDGQNSFEVVVQGCSNLCFLNPTSSKSEIPFNHRIPPFIRFFCSSVYSIQG